MPYDDLKKALERLPQVGDDTGPDFELDPCSGPIWDVQAFLEARKLGPAGRSLYSGLSGYQALTEAQEALLQKVCKKMGHEDWLEPILQEIEEYNHALAHVDAECSLKPEGWHLPGPWGLQNHG
jgi:hypothetical protein